MDTYEIDLEPAEPDGFAAIVPAVPGLLVLGASVDEVLERARAAIAFHVGRSGLGAHDGSPSCRAMQVTRTSHDPQPRRVA